MLLRASIAALLVSIGVAVVGAQSEQRPTFRSSLDLVSVAVVVRGSDGKLVKGLRASDFEILDRGKAQSIVQFQQGEDASARLALLVDASGSMVVGPKRERSRIATELLAAGFQETDSASVFSFDSRVLRLTPYTKDRYELRDAVMSVQPWGITCLYDAIVRTMDIVLEESPRARAVLLLTDGVDTGSSNTPMDAATAAAALDLPVYVLSVGKDIADDKAFPTNPEATVTLNDLAGRTGGLATEAGTAAELSIATRTILNELRHQYVLAFPAGTTRGWHDLTVRVKRGRVQARSRNGYLVS